MHQHFDAVVSLQAEGVTGLGHGLQHAGDRRDHGGISGLDAHTLAERAGGEHRVAGVVERHDMA